VRSSYCGEVRKSVFFRVFLIIFLQAKVEETHRRISTGRRIRWYVKQNLTFAERRELSLESRTRTSGANFEIRAQSRSDDVRQCGASEADVDGANRRRQLCCGRRACLLHLACSTSPPEAITLLRLMLWCRCLDGHRDVTRLAGSTRRYTGSWRADILLRLLAALPGRRMRALLLSRRSR